MSARGLLLILILLPLLTKAQSRPESGIKNFYDNLNDFKPNPKSNQQPIIYQDVGPKVTTLSGDTRISNDSNAKLPEPSSCQNRGSKIPDEYCLGFIPKGESARVFMAYPWTSKGMKETYSEPTEPGRILKGSPPLGANGAIYRKVYFAYIDVDHCGNKEQLTKAQKIWDERPSHINSIGGLYHSEYERLTGLFESLSDALEDAGIPETCLREGEGYVDVSLIQERHSSAYDSGVNRVNARRNSYQAPCCDQGSRGPIRRIRGFLVDLQSYFAR